MAFQHCCGAGGLGILSKVRFEPPRYLDAPSGWFPAMRVILQTRLGPLQALSVHLHPPVSESGSFVKGYFTTTSIRRAELEDFHAQLDPSLPTIVLGDLNEADGKALRFLQDRGYRTGLPEFSPGEKTWRWRLPVGALTSRLDHILYSPGLEPLSVEVLEAGNSDHLPVTAVFAKASPPREGRHSGAASQVISSPSARTAPRDPASANRSARCTSSLRPHS